MLWQAPYFFFHAHLTNLSHTHHYTGPKNTYTQTEGATDILDCKRMSYPCASSLNSSYESAMPPYAVNEGSCILINCVSPLEKQVGSDNVERCVNCDLNHYGRRNEVCTPCKPWELCPGGLLSRPLLSNVSEGGCPYFSTLSTGKFHPRSSDIFLPYNLIMNPCHPPFFSSPPTFRRLSSDAA